MQIFQFRSRLAISVTLFLLAAGCTTPAARKVADVGIIGPAGETLLYFRDGDRIVVRVCATNTVLGETPEEARAICKGPENRIGLPVFKQALRAMITNDRAEALAPLTAAEVTAYRNRKVTEEMLASLTAELEKINARIKAYGEGSTDTARQSELTKLLNKIDAKSVRKVAEEIEKIVAAISNEKGLLIQKDETEQSQFLYTLLSALDPEAKYPCGETGTIADRVADCAQSRNSSKNNWDLVTRDTELKEVWRDPGGAFWGDRLPKAYTEYEAEKICRTDVIENGNLGLTFRLPTADEYRKAEKSGIRTVLPNMDAWSWSSTPYDGLKNVAYVFAGSSGRLFSQNRDNGAYFVRCLSVP